MTSAGTALDPTILRAYDIRGVVGETLSTDDARAIGRAFGTVLAGQGGRLVCVGRDGRLSSPALEEALVDGLVRTGMHVVRIGLGPTPMLYFAAKLLDADGGVMVSGSHNPPGHNGFKLVTRGGALFGDGILALGRIAAEGRFAAGAGSSDRREMLDAYVDRLAADFAGDRPLRVAWDAGNGAAGRAMALLCARLPGAHVLLNAEIDGTFPAHHPDPTVPENLAQLRRAVRTESCEIGIALDGDGDRIGVVDAAGRILWGDQIMILLAREVLADRPGATIIADVKASQVLFDEIVRLGGEPLMWRTGHSLIKAKMEETGAPLAGEMSGHIFFGDRYYGYDDALYAAVRLLGWLSRGTETLAEIYDGLPRLASTPELRIPCPEDRKFAVVAEVRDRLRAAGIEVDDIDGVRVRTVEGWWLLRASNTQAALAARCEAADEAGLARMTAALAEALEASGIAAPDG